MDDRQYGFYFDQNLCNGCLSCVVACRDWNDLPAGPVGWMRLKTVEKGSYPELFVARVTMNCYHCSHPSCASACPVNAITKRDDNGVVEVNREECIGKDQCGLCLEACPYSAPQFGAEENAKMQKCNLCVERITQGKKPACVEACPMIALDAGPIAELALRYAGTSEAEGFERDEKLAPSILFKPKPDKRNLRLKKVIIVPPM